MLPTRSKLGLLLARHVGDLLSRQKEVGVLQVSVGRKATGHAPVGTVDWIHVSSHYTLFNSILKSVFHLPTRVWPVT